MISLRPVLYHPPIKEVFEPDGSSEKLLGTPSVIQARIDQRSRNEFDEQGRDLRISTYLLITLTLVDSLGRITDGPRVYEIAGEPWAVWDSTTIHHYEATLKRVHG